MKNITDFKPGDVAGFSIAGYLQEDGSIILLSGEVLKEVPKQIVCNNIIYNYEDIAKYSVSKRGTFINLNYC
jgi:hypothetical protein